MNSHYNILYILYKYSDIKRRREELIISHLSYRNGLFYFAVLTINPLNYQLGHTLNVLK